MSSPASPLVTPTTSPYIGGLNSEHPVISEKGTLNGRLAHWLNSGAAREMSKAVLFGLAAVTAVAVAVIFATTSALMFATSYTAFSSGNFVPGTLFASTATGSAFGAVFCGDLSASFFNAARFHGSASAALYRADIVVVSQ